MIHVTSFSRVVRWAFPFPYGVYMAPHGNGRWSAPTMSHDSYFEIYLHATWHTKNHAQLLRGPTEKAVHDFIRGRIIAADDAWFDGIGGTDDHIHLAAHVAPTLDIAKWIGDLKGASAHHVNKEIMGRHKLHWQTGYGVVSFGKKNLPFVIDYIDTQRARHGSGKVVDRLERAVRV